ncbi:MAG: IS66 family insertion sequence element accessory protein TnpB [Proteobacteria bacterium]|nr:IS66 family insertion sequence element accessory protein TnpB [Pseudomonadota bacterium]
MIRVEALWLSVAPLDMRAGMDTILAQVVQVFGEARPHHAYLFANRRGTRMKVLIHDGQGIWLACRRLNQGDGGKGFPNPIPGPVRRPGARSALAAARG